MIFGNKRGQSSRDVILLIIMLFGLSIGGLLFHYTYLQISSAMTNTSLINETGTAVTAINAGNTIMNKMDYVILVFFIAFIIGMIIMGYVVDTKSVFMVVYIVVILIGALVAGVLSYTWDVVKANALLATSLGSFPIANHLMTNLLIYYVIAAAMALVATFAKAREESY